MLGMDNRTAAHTLEGLAAIQEIHQLKARYFRLMDTKSWEEWGDVFAEECEMWIEDQPEVTHHRRADILAAVPAVLEGITTVHHGHMGEITLDPPAPGTSTITLARGIWAMQDYLEFPPASLVPAVNAFAAGSASGTPGIPSASTVPGPTYMRGYGHYHETYRCDDAGTWRITTLRLHRIRVDWSTHP